MTPRQWGRRTQQHLDATVDRFERVRRVTRFRVAMLGLMRRGWVT